MTTLDVFLEPIVIGTDNKENKLFEELDKQVLALLFDFFIWRSGPRFRYHY
jgi:hypothetical protein